MPAYIEMLQLSFHHGLFWKTWQFYEDFLTILSHICYRITQGFAKSYFLHPEQLSPFGGIVSQLRSFNPI